MTSQEMIKAANTAIDQAEKYIKPGLMYNRYIRECRYVLQMRLQQVEHTHWGDTDVEGMKKRSLGYPLAELLCALENPRVTLIDTKNKYEELIS